jgi:preprotein translocase subunit SecF
MAVVALFHDVFLAIGAFSFFGLEVDLVIVAAFLTIAGFSVNDTIVIFDRARENIKLHPKYGLKELLNLSVNETLSRTVITSLTVIVATAILFVLGGSVLRNFSLAMLIGLVSGVYSTVGLVTCLVYQWTKDGNYSTMSEQSDSLAHKSGFEAPKAKSKKRYR